VAALLYIMHLRLIRMRYRFQRVPFMTWLPATFSPTAFPLTFWSGFAQSIAGRWFAAVTAVLRNTIFERLYPRSQLPNRAVKQLNYGCFSLIVCSANFFVGWQLEGFHSCIVLAFCDFDNGKVLMALRLSSYDLDYQKKSFLNLVDIKTHN
jgi:hypothetical protein